MRLGKGLGMRLEWEGSGKEAGMGRVWEGDWSGKGLGKRLHICVVVV